MCEDEDDDRDGHSDDDAFYVVSSKYTTAKVLTRLLNPRPPFP